MLAAIRSLFAGPPVVPPYRSVDMDGDWQPSATYLTQITEQFRRELDIKDRIIAGHVERNRALEAELLAVQQRPTEIMPYPPAAQPDNAQPPLIRINDPQATHIAELQAEVRGLTQMHANAVFTIAQLRQGMAARHEVAAGLEGRYREAEKELGMLKAAIGPEQMARLKEAGDLGQTFEAVTLDIEGNRLLGAQLRHHDMSEWLRRQRSAMQRALQILRGNSPLADIAAVVPILEAGLNQDIRIERTFATPENAEDMPDWPVLPVPEAEGAS